MSGLCVLLSMMECSPCAPQLVYLCVHVGVYVWVCVHVGVYVCECACGYVCIYACGCEDTLQRYISIFFHVPPCSSMFSISRDWKERLGKMPPPQPYIRHLSLSPSLSP